MGYTSQEAREQAQREATTATSAEALRIAKERRFSLSASMLTDKAIKVTVENNPNLPLAYMDIKNNELMLNEGDKRLDMSNPVKKLIYTRANLFHEIDHALFTNDDSGKVAALSAKSSDASLFNVLRNVLEDGRIETLGKKRFAGQADFLNAQLLAIAKNLGPTPYDGLHIYVRTGLFRNEGEAKFWQPYKAEIDKAIRASSTSKMLDIAYDLTEALSEPKPKQPQGEQPQEGEQGEQGGEGEGEGDSGEGEEGDEPNGEQGAGDSDSEESGEGEDNEEGEEGEGEGDASDEESEEESEEGDSDEGSAGDSEEDSDNEGEASDSDEGDANEDSEGEGEGDNDSEEDSEGEEDSDEGDEGESEGEDSGASQSSKGAGAGDSKPNELDKETFDKLSEIVAEAMKRCKAEAQSDYDAIIAEAEAYEPEQAYFNEQESGASEELASTFTSLLVESARVSYYSSRAGLLNQAALANALTSRKCFHKREETPQTPHVALLLDVSGSMLGRREELTSAARIVNGALRKAKISANVLTFGGDEVYEQELCLNRFKTIPANEPLQCHGGTPTHIALSAANDWLEGEGATRGLVIVITDGAPNNLDLAQAQLQRAEQSGAYVVGVLVAIDGANYGRNPQALTHISAQFHEHAFCPKVEDLPNVLAPMLATYIAQS